MGSYVAALAFGLLICCNAGMNWSVFTEQSTREIQLHWITAILALVVGLVILARRKGTPSHKTLGSIYVLLMVITSASAFFIRSGDVSGWRYLTLAGMSWIHLFIPLTLLGIVGGLHGILVKKDAKAHRGPIIGSFIGGLVIAGGLTLLPGRRMYELFFGALG